MKKAIKLAIFDIDGTIFRSSLLIELVRGLVRHKIFSSSAEKEVQKEYLAWLDRKGSYSDYIQKVVHIYIKYIAGKSLKKVYRVAREVVRYQKDRTYRFTRELIQKLKKQKYFLVAISGSPVYIVKEYARATGFHAYFGTEIEIQPVRSKSRQQAGTADAQAHQTSNGLKNGKFTNKVLSLDAAYHKKKVLMDFAASQNIKVDWKNSAAVGDTETDISILQIVGKPIAFNPNHQLAKVAKARGWRIVVERKDVVYEIQDFKFRI